MKLTKVRITEITRAFIDSNEFDIGDVTCLVGKNEAGKTAYPEGPMHRSESHHRTTEGGF